MSPGDSGARQRDPATAADAASAAVVTECLRRARTAQALADT